MLCREYSILPFEPTVESTRKTIEVDLPVVSGVPIEENFLQCKVSVYNKTE